MDERDRLRLAIFERISFVNSTWKVLATKHNVTISKLRTAYRTWSENPPAAQPQSYRDIHIPFKLPGRPCALSDKHETIIVKAIKHFADLCTPLTRQGVIDLIQEYLENLPSFEQERAGFFNNRPSLKLVDNLMQRHNLCSSSVRMVKDKRVDAVTMNTVTEHIARVQAAMDRYHIHDARYVFNMDQSGCALWKILGRSLRKGVGEKGRQLIQKCIGTKGDLDRVTIMPVVSAAGTAYTPCIIYPGKTAHYRIVNGRCESLHSNLIDCLLYHRDPAGADSAIVYDWAKCFVAETAHLRSKNQRLLLLLDGYAAHVQFDTLQLFRQNKIITLALPSHTSHELQPLDVAVFGPFKSYLQRELHRAAHVKNQFNAFDIASVIHNAYSLSFVAPTIRSGFIKTGIWDPTTRATNVQALRRLFMESSSSCESNLDTLLTSFMSRNRTLLRDANVEEEGRIMINTRTGAHITSDVVLDALEKRKKKKLQELQKKEQQSSKASIWADVKEPAAAIRHLGELAERRFGQRKMLRMSREARRRRQRNMTTFKRIYKI